MITCLKRSKMSIHKLVVLRDKVGKHSKIRQLA